MREKGLRWPWSRAIACVTETEPEIANAPEKSNLCVGTERHACASCPAKTFLYTRPNLGDISRVDSRRTRWRSCGQSTRRSCSSCTISALLHDRFARGLGQFVHARSPFAGPDSSGAAINSHNTRRHAGWEEGQALARAALGAIFFGLNYNVSQKSRDPHDFAFSRFDMVVVITPILHRDVACMSGKARKALHELRLVHLREVERRKRAEQEVSDLRRRQASSSSTSRRPDSWQDASSPSGSDIDCKSRSETFDTRTSEQGFNSRDELLGKSGSSPCMSHDEDVRTPVGGRDKSGHVERFAGVGRLMTPNANASRRLEDPRTRDTWADGTRGDSAGSSSSAKKVNRCQLEGGNKGIPSPNISGLRDQANTLVGGENRDGSYGVHHSAFAVASRPGQSVIGVAQARRPGTRGPLPGQPAGHGSTPPKLNGNGNVDQSRGQQTSHLGSQRIGTPGRPARPSWHVDRECRVDSGRGTALWPRARKMEGSTNSRDRQTATPTRSTENKEQPQPPHGRSQVRESESQADKSRRFSRGMRSTSRVLHVFQTFNLSLFASFLSFHTVEPRMILQTR